MTMAEGDEVNEVSLVSYAIPEKANSVEFKQISMIAKQLLDHLNQPNKIKELLIANQPGNSSAMVQDVFIGYAEELGFESEKKGLFKEYSMGMRPDYYMKTKSSGIIIEVERGKTTINNMDMLDFWKTHLCNHANHLFLFVPKELRQNETMKPKKEFNNVKKRLEKFFLPGNETNVHTLHLFGY